MLAQKPNSNYNIYKYFKRKQTMIKTCCCTGHRPKGFPFRYGIDLKKHKSYMQLLEQKIALAINEYGITDFISGMALGVDIDFNCVTDTPFR